MADNKEYISYVNDMGNIHISEEVVAAIAAEAAAEVEGVAGLRAGHSRDNAEQSGRKVVSRGIKVRLAENQLSIDVYLLAKADLPLANLGSAVQQAVKAAVEAATGVTVQSVNVNVIGVKA
ncbi:MAG: Asp23/Gls24 family envelope stress response protein [Oscillospiraceae bacterium]|nr:Asp23/Gls24 family envelope stress response protein [Oscillospiraceae bacterium]